MAAFTPGNIVVYRVGNGTGSLVNTGNAVFLDEYTTAGVLVQSIAMPTADTGASNALIASGTASSEGLITLSTDGRYIMLAGYNATPGGAVNLTTSSSATIQRTVGRVDWNGTVDTSTALSDFATGSNPRGVASTNGTDLWITGGAGGVRYTTLGATTSLQLSTTTTNLRAVEIFDGQLYVSAASGTTRVATVGSGTPTTSGQTITTLPGLPTGSGSPYAFYLADLSAAVAGVDTLYIADDGGGAGILKYSLVGGTWTANGTITAVSIRGLTGSTVGTTVNLFGTTGGTSATGGGSIYAFSDTTGYNGAVSGTVTTIATAATNTAFRGIAFAPQAAAATPTITIQAAPISQAEGNSGTTAYVFTLTRSSGTSDATVAYAVTGSGGLDGADFVGGTLPSGTATFSGSSLTTTITINVAGDSTIEADETFTVTLSDPSSGYVLGSPASQTGTITNDDTPVLSIDNVSMTEGDSGTVTYTFTVSLDRAAPTGGVTFDIATADDSATTADGDYVGRTLTGQTIAAGLTSYTFDVTVNGDTAVEPNELFFVNVTSVVNATVGDGQGTGTIVNNDQPPIPVASVADVAIAEGNSGVSYLVFTVSLSFAPTAAVTIDYATSNGTAAAGSDYLAVSGQLSFAAGETTKTVSVPVIGDTAVEASETLNLTLSNPSGATIGDDTGVGTITNDDSAAGGYYPLATGSFSEDWSNTGRITTDDNWSGVPFITGYLGDVSTGTTSDVDPTSVSHQGPALGAVDVLANQTNPSAAGSGGVAEFQPGATPETNFVPNPTIALQGSGTADAPSIVLYMDSSGRTDVRLQATLRDLDYNADNSAQQINVQYRTDPTGNWTNVPGGHFTDVTTGGSATQTTALDVVLPAGANNSPTLQIRIMTVNAGGTDEWVGIDDIVVSSQGGPGLSIADAAAFEGTGGSSSIAFTVTRTGDTSGASSANWTITFAGATFPASAGDLAAAQSLTGNVAFASGETSKTIVVALEPDADPEADEGFTITLSSPTGASLTDASALGTIVNDDGAPPFVTISDVTQVETNSGNPAFVFTVTRTGGTGAFDVSFQTVDGTATGGTDYVITSGTLNFAANEMSKTIEILVFGDTDGEFDETFTVQLTGATNFAVIADPTGTGTIVNDDLLYIHQIQGTSYYSPILAAEGKNGFNVVSSTVVTIQAVVTAVDNDGTRQGFYITEETGQWDANSLTSEGIFVMAQYDTSDTSNPPPGTGTTLAALLTANGIDPAGFAPGDLVTVTARVMEYQAFDTMPRTVLWQVSSITKNSSGNALPVLTLDAGRPIPNSILTGVTPDYTDSADDAGDTFDSSLYALSYFETVEGMLVTVPDMVVADGFVSTVGAANDPVFQAYSRVHADADQINSRGGYTIAGDPPLSPPDTADTDDGTIHGGRHIHDGDTNPDIIELDFSDFAMTYPAGQLDKMSMGDGLGDVTGIIEFDFTDRKLFVTGINPASYQDTVPARETTTFGSDDRALTVATFNVENLDPGDGAARFAALAAVIANNMNSPDIVIIEEMQDNNGAAAGDGSSATGTDASVTWQMLVDALNLATGAHYQWVDEAPVYNSEGGQQSGNIRVGFLYDTNRVQLGNLAPDATIAERRQFTDRIGDGVRDAGDQIQFSDDMIAGEINLADWSNTRKSLLAQFTFHGQTVFVAANHFPAKTNSGDFWQLNQNLEAGQPVNADFVQRNNVANDLYTMLNHIQANAPGAGVVSGGDYNDFYFYRPLEVATGYVLPDGTARAGGARFDNLTVTELTEAERYSYTFDGRSQTLDHIIVNGMLSAVAGYDVVHVNTGYSDLGTGANANPALSDHDPAVASFDFRSLNETLVGTPQADFFDLSQGGDDTVSGLGGNDTFLFGGTMTSADRVDGGPGTDQIALQGNYSGGNALTLGADVVSVEILAIMPGSDTRFGDPGTNFYDYNITTQNVNVAPGTQMIVDANALRNGEDLTFNGAAETDGSFFIYAGAGADTLTGGALGDVFLFGLGRWGAGDSVDGGAGLDQLALRGGYTIAFGATQIAGIESLALLSAFDTRFGPLNGGYSYDLTMNDGNVAGIQMTVDGATLRANETLTFDGSAEDDGSFRVFGGAGDDDISGSQNADTIVGRGGADTLTGNGGDDVFRYNLADESTSAGQDEIQDFTLGDLVDLSRIDADTTQAGNQAFTFIEDEDFSDNAGELRFENVSGSTWLVQGDTNGDGDSDFELILIIADANPITSGDFIL